VRVPRITNVFIRFRGSGSTFSEPDRKRFVAHQ
jgi:hypothetical protein